MCLYNWAYSKENDKRLWWEYIAVIHAECNGIVNADCSELAHERIGVDYTTTMTCVNNSFTAPHEDWKLPTTNNTLIDKDLKYWKQFGSSLYPAIIINN